MGLSGIGWMSRGIHRRLDGQTSNLSGKPTFLSVLLNDGWVAAYDPKQTPKEKPPEGGFGISRYLRRNRLGPRMLNPNLTTFCNLAAI